ncbi:hypothetical protein [Pseudoalteromonas sp. T1lg88]|uniref:hypothetical protein n=1 Tax=Pseudoalteromonas sp. T1lg88 TaxID=2077104 RepID=UPI000CF6E2D4|nr:hypothetical protein [Pseudoalteromonas sp. T1lg88]
MSYPFFHLCSLTPRALLLSASALIMSFMSGQAWAQTQVLVGGGLQVCSSMTPEHCQQSLKGGKASSLFKVDENALARLDRHWPSQYQTQKESQIKALKALVSEQAMTQEQLLTLWYQQAPQAQLLARPLYYYVLDTLELAEPSQKVRLDTYINSHEATGDILAFMQSSISVAAGQQAQPPQVLMLTSASRDPYASADYYQQLLASKSIDGQWLPLTPALAKALSQGRCDKLNEFRQQALIFDRARVYPERIAEEQALCSQGVEALTAQIEAASAVFFNDGDQTLASAVLYDEQGKEYPWTEALRTRPVILANGTGSAIQSGGSNAKGAVAVITGGDAFAALENKVELATKPTSLPSGYAAISYEPEGGLGTFNYGVLDTQFSDDNRSLRLHSLLYGAEQLAGYGIDAGSALVVITSGQDYIGTVLGEAGVVKIQPLDTRSFRYSYYPSGVRLTLEQQQWRLATDTKAIEVKGPDAQALPQMRFGDILYDGKLRSLTQAMCLSNSKMALATQYTRGQYWDFTLRSDQQTRMLNTDIRANACAIEGLIIEFAPRN